MDKENSRNTSRVKPNFTTFLSVNLGSVHINLAFYQVPVLVPYVCNLITI